MSFTTPSPDGADRPPSRRRIPLALAIVALLIAAGTAGGATALYFEFQKHASSGVQVTDDLGRTVTVPQNPSRVVALGPNIVDTLVRLGLSSHLVGVDCSNTSLGGIYGDYTPDQVKNWSLSSVPCVTAFPALSAAELIAAMPQVVIASSIISVAALESFSSAHNIPLLIVSPTTLGGVVYDVELFAFVFGSSSATTSLVSELQRGLGNAAAFQGNLSANGTPLRSVLMTYYPIPAGSPGAGYYSFGPGTFGQSLIELAGGANIAGAASVSSPDLSGSQVLAANPSLILIGIGFGVNASNYATGPDWGSFPAVMHGNVSAIDVTWMTEVGPTMILELEAISAILYPGLVTP